MSEFKMVAQLRTEFGKGFARRMRAAGQTPAVIYGHGNATRHISLPAHQAALALRFKNSLLELDIAGKTELVLVKSASKDPVTQIIEHIDLIEVIKGELVHVEVPVHLVGEPMSGTLVELEHKTMKLQAEATNVPEYVELIINKEREAGNHYTVADLVILKGVKFEFADTELIAAVVETRAGHAEDLAESKS